MLICCPVRKGPRETLGTVGVEGGGVHIHQGKISDFLELVLQQASEYMDELKRQR